MGLLSSELFPTTSSFIVFVAYMALFINQGIVVTATKEKDNGYKYNTVTVVLLAELFKLIAASVIYLREFSFGEFFKAVRADFSLCLYYLVPSFLYCLYNNLAFINLANYDPTTYFLLLQFRVVVTGVLFQFVFKKKLSGVQWGSLLLLTVGCIIKEVNHESKADDASSDVGGFKINYHLFLILIQVFSSCFAGVYNEKLMKDRGCDVHLMIQNVYMYLDSILCNLGFLFCMGGGFTQAFTPSALSSVVLRPLVMTIILNNAAIGIVTSLFLRKLNSILKTFASALELLFTGVLCWMIFGIALDGYTILALFIVSGAIVLYSRNPVVNPAKNEVLPISKSDEAAAESGKS